MTSNIPYIYPYVLNNPLKFTDPSGYRPVGIFEEETRMTTGSYNSAGSGWDPFGWISRGMSMAGWADMTGPNLSQWHYWNDNVKGNPLNGESSSEFTTWYRMMRYGNSNQQTEDWANAIEYGINSSADVTTVNRYGVSTLNLIEDTPIAAYLLFGMNLDLSDTNYLINLLASNGEGDEVNDGGTWALTGSFAFLGGLNFELGKVWDSKDNSKWYFTFGPSVGFDISFGIVQKNIYNSPDFSVQNYQNYSSSIDIAILVFDGIIVAGDNFDKSYKSRFGATYGEGGWGISVGSPLGVTWNMGRTITWGK